MLKNTKYVLAEFLYQAKWMGTFFLCVSYKFYDAFQIFWRNKTVLGKKKTEIYEIMSFAVQIQGLLSLN